MSDNIDPTPTKKFGLKDIEVQMLNTMQDMYFSSLSNFLSFIAMERLAYHVTPTTKFKVDGKTLEIYEDEQTNTETPSAADAASSVSTGTDTTTSLGGKQ